MKQLGLAFTQYTQDADEKLPYGSNPDLSDGGNGRGWAGAIYSFVKATGVFKCPDDSSGPSTDTPPKQPVSYGYSRCLASNPRNGNSGIALSSWNSPASTVMLWEIRNNKADMTNVNEHDSFCSHLQFPNSNPGDNWPNGNGGDNDTGTNVGGVPTNAVSATGRHTDSSNWLLCDGHVKWLHSSAVSPGENAQNATDPQGLPADDGGRNAAGTSALSTGSFQATFSVN